MTANPAEPTPTATGPQLLQGSRKQPLLALLLLFIIHLVSAQNPRDNFCRRFGHQTTVIDDKLYIDGGWVNFDDFQQSHEDIPNKWLGYRDLNNLVPRSGDNWPDLNISLSKNGSIPTVHGGVLWGDAVNKRFYLYGGSWTKGLPQKPYRVVSYDILYDRWDDHGLPSMSTPPLVASQGAGVGVSEIGMGYYYGGWIDNTSMSGWTQPPAMSSNFYRYAYETNKFTTAASPDDIPRAEGAMVWIPAGDSLGLIVYMGGIIGPHGNSTASPQSFDKILVFDATANSWSTQTATGEIPQNRRQFCIDVAWAPDKSSFNIYLWGGLSFPSPGAKEFSLDDIFILTLPSFIWVKAYPDHQGNPTTPPKYGHHRSSCNMVKSMSQLFVIGGTYSETNGCDLAVDAWAQHDFWTGTNQNMGDNKTYWALYDPNVTSNVVPVDVYSVVGGNKYGSATVMQPKAGFDSGNKALEDLLGRRPSISSRSPTRYIPSPTSPPTKAPTASPGPALSTGGIVGVAVGGAIGLLLVLSVWLYIGRRVVRRREERRKSKMTQPWRSDGSIPGTSPSMTSPHTPMGHVFGTGPGNPLMWKSRPMSELPT
ncbi:hypothetical protein QQS21_000076 [Conoideocrella luteorostrata]|uniref:Kelch repeat protein n=1 Tax=Conoideocrella luteorostrata TaxID=1105319 RepID=A0AAJ0G2S7_9HYPO|nr:hypothetical protein QQS21_000076 [Conoideocrella luteorostrata]